MGREVNSGHIWGKVVNPMWPWSECLTLVRQVYEEDWWGARCVVLKHLHSSYMTGNVTPMVHPADVVNDSVNYAMVGRHRNGMRWNGNGVDNILTSCICFFPMSELVWLPSLTTFWQVTTQFCIFCLIINHCKELLVCHRPKLWMLNIKCTCPFLEQWCLFLQTQLLRDEYRVWCTLPAGALWVIAKHSSVSRSSSSRG